MSKRRHRLRSTCSTSSHLGRMRVMCKIWYLISRTVSEDDAHRGH